MELTLQTNTHQKTNEHIKMTISASDAAVRKTEHVTAQRPWG